MSRSRKKYASHSICCISGKAMGEWRNSHARKRRRTAKRACEVALMSHDIESDIAVEDAMVSIHATVFNRSGKLRSSRFWDAPSDGRLVALPGQNFFFDEEEGEWTEKCRRK